MEMEMAMEMEMEEQMEQLLSMGFPSELATQALAATGGKSTLKATEWILSHKSQSQNSNPNPNPQNNNNNNNTNHSPPPPSSSSQPKLDRFFHFQSKPPNSSSSNSPPNPTPTPTPTPTALQKNHHHYHKQDEQQSIPLSSKRPRLVPPVPPPPTPTNAATTINSTINNHHHDLPLSERLRPHTIDDILGQDHLLSHNSVLRSAIHCNRLPSFILWGPPGSGKTSIVKAITNSSSYWFVSFSAVACGVKDVRDAVEDARKKNAVKNGKRTVLFIDEVHRFNKSQQDSFLPVIEDGSIVFVGATTENPSFHLITPLLSRCRVLTVNPLKPHHVHAILRRAINDGDKGLSKSLGLVGVGVEVSEDAIEFLSGNCDGDARVALNALEISATIAAARVSTDRNGNLNSNSNSNSNSGLVSVVVVTLDDAKEALQCKHLAYDRAGEEHYNLISALHKSMRGSDADASIYWLARMLEGGEQPLYIARRMIRFASEDVGLADPTALNQAVACYQACHFLGMPECNVILAQCVAYLALAPKSIAVYRAIEAAQNLVRESVGLNEGVPLHLRNAPTKLMKELGYGKGYIYTPDYPSSIQSYLPPSLQGYKFLDWPVGNADDR